MPSVNSPADGQIQSYYLRQMGEMENQAQAQSERAEKEHSREVSQSEENHQANLRDKEDEANENVRRAKDDVNQLLEQERENHRREIQEKKAGVYDKFGRYSNSDGDELRQQLQESVREKDELSSRSRQALAEQDDYYSRKMEDQEKRHTRELEGTADKVKTSSRKLYDEYFDQHRDEYNSYKDEAKRNNRDIIQNSLSDQQLETKRAQQTVEEAERDFKNRNQVQEDSERRRLDHQSRAHALETEKTEMASRDSREREVGELREQVKTLVDDRRRYAREIGQGTAEAIKKYEAEFRNRERILTDTYDREATAVKARSAKTEEDLMQAAERRLTERDANYGRNLDKLRTSLRRENSSFQDNKAAEYTQAIARMQGDSDDAMKHIRSAYEEQHAQDQTKQHHERDLAERKLENHVHRSTEQRENALKAQAQAYDDSMTTQNRINRDQIQALERELQFKNTTAEVSEISPAAEEAIRNQTRVEDYLVLDEQLQSSGRSIDELRQKHHDDLLDIQSEHDLKFRELTNKSSLEIQSSRNELMNMATEAEDRTRRALQDQELQHLREAESQYRQFARSMDRQKRQFEELLQKVKLEEEAKTQEIRLQADFESRKAQRDFRASHSDQVREFEKKITDMKVDYETLLSETKLQHETVLSETQRKHQSQLQEQARTFEQRMEGFQAQASEREKYLTQNFEDELERTRRANALLIKKKS